MSATTVAPQIANIQAAEYFRKLAVALAEFKRANLVGVAHLNKHHLPIDLSSM